MVDAVSYFMVDVEADGPTSSSSLGACAWHIASPPDRLGGRSPALVDEPSLSGSAALQLRLYGPFPPPSGTDKGGAKFLRDRGLAPRK